MSYRQVFTLLPVSPWSTDQFGDAAKGIAAATGQTQSAILASASLSWWNDPYPGSGRWEWLVSYNFPVGTSGELDLYTIGSKGNASISIGGPLSAPAPIFATQPFTTSFQKASPLTPTKHHKTAVMTQGNSAGVYRPHIMPQSPTLLADVAAVVSSYVGGSSQNSWKYFYDRRTGSTLVNGVTTPTGTGLWQVRGTSWMALGQANIFCVVQVQACAIGLAGGEPGIAVPSSWVTGTITFVQEQGQIFL